MTTGNQLSLALGTHRGAGAIADVRVRQAVNYAIDKVAYRDAIAGRWAATGELASTILAPDSLGYRPYDLYPTPGGRGDPAKAMALLARAGYPDGLTLRFATASSGPYAAANKVVRKSLARAGIDQRTMRDAPMVPLIWERYSFSWSSRVHGWAYDPLASMPDLTAVWLDPPSS